jgi:hypothetical protein
MSQAFARQSRKCGKRHAAALEVCRVCDDLAYTVGFENDQVAVVDAAPVPMTIRVNHTYRRFDENWYLVHRRC